MVRKHKIISECDICGKESLSKLSMCPICKSDYCQECERLLSVFVKSSSPIKYSGDGSHTSYTYLPLEENAEKVKQLKVCSKCSDDVFKQIKKEVENILNAYN